MTEQEQIIACAELDGWKLRKDGKFYVKNFSDRIREASIGSQILGYYLTSRDAIIPLIEKQPYHIKEKIIEILWDRTKSFEDMMIDSLTRPISKLSEALLRATGKWK